MIFMAQAVNVNFRLDAEVKKSEVSVHSFYSESNMRYLQKKMAAYRNGTLPVEAHTLMED